MPALTVRRAAEPAWDEVVDRLGGHPLQAHAWGSLKAAHGWRVHRIEILRSDEVVGAASVLVRPLPWPLRSLAYTPRGPVVADLADAHEVTAAIATWVKRELGSVALTIEPDWEVGTVDPGSWNGVRLARTTFLYPHTLVLDLTRPLADLLADAHKNTRYYIRRAAKTGMDIHRVTTEDELESVLSVFHQTAERADFGVHTDEYYRDLFRLAGDTGLVFAAFDDEGTAQAFNWTITSARTAFELYGGVTDIGQKMRVTHAVKWAVISHCHAQGVARYDMNGLLTEGITAFKKSFADIETDLVGSFDIPLSPLFAVWDRGLPLARAAGRRLRKLRTR